MTGLLLALAAEIPDTAPRWYTGVAEWSAALVYILILRPRFTGWRRWTAIVVALPLMIGLQTMVGTWSLRFWMLGMGLAVAAIFSFIYFCTESNLKDTGYLTARAFVLAELVASLQWQFGVHWASSPSDNSLLNGGIAFMVVVYGVGFVCAYLAESRNIPREKPLDVEGRNLIVALAIALATFLISNLSFSTTATPISGTASSDIFYIRTLVDLVGFVALYAQQSSRNQVRNSMELAETRLVMRSQHDQYLQSKRNIEELNRLHHDLKHYVAAIRQEESADQRADYLNKLEDSMRGYESEVQTGNQLLDIILSSKMERCLQENISMTVMVQGEALRFMDSMSVSALFGNALDNAIEASLKIPQTDQRLVKVSLFTQGEFVMIRFENHYPHPVKFVEGVPISTKRHPSRHGYGTLSMRRIVESYGGSLTLGLEGDWFAVRALIPLRSDRQHLSPL